jgi:hypothetical protein
MHSSAESGRRSKQFARALAPINGMMTAEKSGRLATSLAPQNNQRARLIMSRTLMQKFRRGGRDCGGPACMRKHRCAICIGIDDGHERHIFEASHRK